MSVVARFHVSNHHIAARDARSRSLWRRWSRCSQASNGTAQEMQLRVDRILGPHRHDLGCRLGSRGGSAGCFALPPAVEPFQ